MPLVGVAAGCNLSEPSRVAGPSGSTSHTATAMDPVHGSQWSVSSTDITLTAKQGPSMGEVSTGTASTALTGQRSQPTAAAVRWPVTRVTSSDKTHLARAGQLPAG